MLTHADYSGAAIETYLRTMKKKGKTYAIRIITHDRISISQDSMLHNIVFRIFYTASSLELVSNVVEERGKKLTGQVEIVEERPFPVTVLRMRANRNTSTLRYGAIKREVLLIFNF